MITSDASELKTETSDRPQLHALKSGAFSGAVPSRNEKNQPEIGALSGALGQEKSDPPNEETQVNPGIS